MSSTVRSSDVAQGEPLHGSTNDTVHSVHGDVPTDGLDCTVVVPVLDEEDSISTLVDEISDTFAGLERSWEIMFVDDGSRDRTWERIMSVAAEHPSIRALKLRRNFGKATALSIGVEHARGSVIITMDGDLQDDPAEIPRFLEEVEKGDRLVSGWKVERHDPLSKRMPSKLFNRVTSLVSGTKLRDHNCGFKAGPVELYRSIPLYGELHRFIPALAQDLGYEVVELPVNHRPRQHGRSKFGFERYVRGSLDLVTVVMITRYRRRPGHLLGGVGVALGGISLAIMLYLTALWIFTDQGIGTRPLLALGVLLAVVSLQLISLGVIAELIVNRSERTDRANLVSRSLLCRGSTGSP